MITAEESFNVKEPIDSLDYILKLKEKAFRLTRFGWFAFAITFFNLVSLSGVILFVAGVAKSLSRPEILIFWRFPFVISSLLFLFLVLVIFLFEKEKRSGDAIFDEVVDEIKWDVKGESKEISDERPNLDTRIALRSFVKAEELPLVPGKFGPIIYIVFNLLLLMAIVLLRPSMLG